MLTNTERQQIVEEVNAGTYGIDEALDDIAAAQKGEEVRKALYAEALVLNREGHAGSTDMIARQQIANLRTSVNGQISTLRTEVGEDIDDLETALNSGLATQNSRIAAQNATIANVVANYNVEYGSTELWASTGETGALAAGTTVTLSEDVSHFDYIDIYSFLGNNNILDTLPVDAKLQSNDGYALRWVNLSDPGSGTYEAYVRIIETKIKIIGTTLTIIHQVTYSNGASVSISGAEITQSNRSTYVGELGIMKVVGRKITANTEVTDIRTGVDGTVYTSAGQAVRTQIEDVTDAIPAVDSTLSTQGAAADAKAAGDALSGLSNSIGDKATLHTTAKSSLVAAVNEVNDSLASTSTSVNASIGTLSQLETDNKTNLVAAINEIKGSGVTQQLDILYLYGDETEIQSNWTDRSKAKMNFRYVFHNRRKNKQKVGYCKLSLQGNATLQYSKHNFNIQFFKDAGYATKDKVDYLDLTGDKHPKWTIKANYNDYSQARNVVSARLWGDVVHCRTGMSKALSDAPNHGAIDGHPIILYMNDVYYGLYMFNMSKSDWMLGIDEDDPKHCAVSASIATNATKWLGTGFSGWELEIPDTWQSPVIDGVTISVSAGFSALQSFVLNSSDADFYSGLDTYLDVNSAIDYLIYMFCVCNADSMNKNQFLVTWNAGQKWFFTAYDMDQTFGAGFTDEIQYNHDLFSTHPNHLFERIIANFSTEILARYAVLRAGALSEAYINRELEILFNEIPSGAREADLAKWPGIKFQNISTLSAMQTFVHNRLEWCDRYFARLDPNYVPCTGLSLSPIGIDLYDINDTATITATVTPSNCSDTLVWTTSDASVATVENGVVTALADGNCTITATCGDYSATVGVSVQVDSSIIYRFPANLVGTVLVDEWDSGVQVFPQDADITVVVDFAGTSFATVSIPHVQIATEFRLRTNNGFDLVFGGATGAVKDASSNNLTYQQSYLPSTLYPYKVVITHRQGEATAQAYVKDTAGVRGSTTVTKSSTNTSWYNTSNLKVSKYGSRAVINNLLVYNRVLTQSEIDDFLS